MKTLTVLIALVLFPYALFNNYAEVSDDLVNAIKQGNAKAIGEYFSEKVDMKVLDQEDVYSKAQAESILKNFFEKYKVKNFTPSHSSTHRTNNQFVVGDLETQNGKFRISFLLKKTENKYLISQFRIEKENE